MRKQEDMAGKRQEQEIRCHHVESRGIRRPGVDTSRGRGTVRDPGDMVYSVRSPCRGYRRRSEDPVD